MNRVLILEIVGMRLVENLSALVVQHVSLSLKSHFEWISCQIIFKHSFLDEGLRYIRLNSAFFILFDFETLAYTLVHVVLIRFLSLLIHSLKRVLSESIQETIHITFLPLNGIRLVLRKIFTALNA